MPADRHSTKAARDSRNAGPSAPCTICSRVLSRHCDMGRHLVTHTDKKPFQCSECDSAFSQATALKIHRNTHTGETPYKCKDCSKAFGDPSVLTRHRKEQHLGVVLLFCTGCTKTFKRAEVLRAHLKKVHSNLIQNVPVPSESHVSTVPPAPKARHPSSSPFAYSGRAIDQCALPARQLKVCAAQSLANFKCGVESPLHSILNNEDYTLDGGFVNEELDYANNKDRNSNEPQTAYKNDYEVEAPNLARSPVIFNLQVFGLERSCAHSFLSTRMPSFSNIPIGDGSISPLTPLPAHPTPSRTPSPVTSTPVYSEPMQHIPMRGFNPNSGCIDPFLLDQNLSTGVQLYTQHPVFGSRLHGRQQALTGRIF